MHDDIIKQILDDSTQLYSLPQTLAEVLRIIKDETSSADDLSNIIAKDPAITAKLLRVVNSPYYGAPREIGSIKQAVMTLGIRQVTALTLSTQIYNMTEKWESCLDRIRFWRHSLEMAIAARTIAEKIGYNKLEEIFVAGLLHDIGLLILENSFTLEFESVWEEANKSANSILVEEEAWGTNHARVGQFLLEQWHLPETICEAVGKHHSDFAAGADDLESIPGQILNLACHLSQFSLTDSQVGESSAELEKREIVRINLKLSTEQLIDIQRHLFSQTVNESKYLEMEIGSTEQLLTEANRMLFEQYATVESLLDENVNIRKSAAGDKVRTDFLETVKGTAGSAAEFVAMTSGIIEDRAQKIQQYLDTDNYEKSKSQISNLVQELIGLVGTLASVMKEMDSLTHTGPDGYDDQSLAKKINMHIKNQMESIEQPTSVS